MAIVLLAGIVERGGLWYNVRFAGWQTALFSSLKVSEQSATFMKWATVCGLLPEGILMPSLPS